MIRFFCAGEMRANSVTVSTVAASAPSLIRSTSAPVTTRVTSSPTSVQTWRATRSLSPVSTLTVTPLSRSARRASFTPRSGGSKNATKPAIVSARSSSRL